jgi:hypothetical protein
MTVSRKQFSVTVFALAALAVALFPIWPWSRWGYFPSFLIAGIVVFMYAFKRLARE